MPRILRAFSLAVTLAALTVSAAPKKKGGGAKAAPAAAPAPSRSAPPSVNLNSRTPAPEASAAPEGAPPPSRGPTRIDFDDRLIQGQTNKSGSVYLYDRKELKVRSMVKKRDSFRDEIIGSLYDG